MLRLPPIDSSANKYTRGCLLILAGSARFPGAALLAALAAERAGAGYTTLAIPSSVVSVAQSHLLSIPVIAAAETAGSFAAHALSDILPQLNRIDAILAGPGMTVTESTALFMSNLLRHTACPLVLDADALNLLGKTDQNGELIWQLLPPDTILTPHGGELERLLKTTATETPLELAQKLNSIVVSKGPVTTVFCPDEKIAPFEYRDGTPALAKAGTGDVLAGIVSSLLAQGASAWEAATGGVVLHGLAGRLAETNGSTRSVVAHDIICALSAAFREVEGF